MVLKRCSIPTARSVSKEKNQVRTDGTLRHGNGGTQVQLGRTQPGEVPGTQMRTWGEVNGRGRDSSVSGGRTWSTADGTELGRTSGTLDQRRYSEQASVGVGQNRGAQNSTVVFGGVNTPYEQRQTLRGGPVQGSTTTTVNRNGASTGRSVSVGGKKVEAKANVTTSGGSIQVGGAKIRW